MISCNVFKMKYVRYNSYQAVDVMVQNTGMNRIVAEAEVDRYSALPGQACSYKVLELNLVDGSFALICEIFYIGFMVPPVNPVKTLNNTRCLDLKPRTLSWLLYYYF